MPRVKQLKHSFVESFPNHIEEGMLYVSMEYATATHRCCCGCGSEIVTPLSPHDWKLTYDGETISLHPSIGNWSFPCRSHYWIISNRVKWSYEMAQEKINEGRKYDRWQRSAGNPTTVKETETKDEKPPESRLWKRLLKKLIR